MSVEVAPAEAPVVEEPPQPVESEPTEPVPSEPEEVPVTEEAEAAAPMEADEKPEEAAEETPTEEEKIPEEAEPVEVAEPAAEEQPAEIPVEAQPEPEPVQETKDPAPEEDSESEVVHHEEKLYWISRLRNEESAAELADMRPDSEAWTNQELHLFIVTDAGKPVYSRYGTVQKLSPILCTCVAILGHMDSLAEELNHFRAGSHTFVFLPKKPFVFIAVSKSSLPVSYLFKQLNFLYNLFLSLFSENLINQLSMRPSCDFRQIAEGTRPAWDGVVNNMSEDPGFVFAPSIPVGHIRPDLRTTIIRHFDGLPACKLSMLMHRNRVLAVGTCTCDSLSLRLIVDLMWTPAFQNGESWTPFFARDSTDGMHHLYINKHRGSDFALVMLCSDSERLIAYHSAAVTIFKELENTYINDLKKPLEGAPDVFYCWAVHSITHGQVYITDPNEKMFGDADPKVSQKKMQELCRQLAKSNDMVETNGVEGEYMFRSEKEVIVVAKNKEMEIYAVANSADLPDSEISEKLGELKSYIQSHFSELIISDNKFHVERFA